MYAVYKHTAPSGKVYVGITGRAVEKRWENGSGYKGDRYFHSAIEKYGRDNIKHEIVCTGLSRRQACRAGQSPIKYFDGTNRDKGYNHGIGGECGSSGAHPSGETREKPSKAHKGKRPSDGCIIKAAEAHRGNRPSGETGKKIGMKLKGRPSSGKTREKMSEARKGEMKSRGDYD